MKKRILTLALALVMSVSMFTMNVSAAELTQTAESGANVSESEAAEADDAVNADGSETDETDDISDEEQSIPGSDNAENESASEADTAGESTSPSDAAGESMPEEASDNESTPESDSTDESDAEETELADTSAEDETETIANTVDIISSLLTKNPCYVEGTKIQVKGLMLHSVGCSQPNALAFVRNWNSASHDNTCVHAFIDANTGVVYQTLPWNYRGWHCGHGVNGSGNDTHISVEMCEPACITYTGSNTFTMDDVITARASIQRTYESAVTLFAMLCQQYNLDPLEDGVIISHREGHTRGIASNHGDPEHLWRGAGLPYTMDTFRAAVKAKMDEGKLAWAYENDDPVDYSDVTSIFNDVPSSSWYHDAVQYVYDNGLMTGLDATNFGPAAILSRAQFAVILWRMNGSPAQTYSSKFPDVGEGRWYTDAVLWANSVGVVTGYENGDFGPADIITREQMALMMYRYANARGYDCSLSASIESFKDAERVSGFANEAMQWAVGMKIITGTQNGTALEPQGKASRAECATIIMRFLKAYT